MPGTPLPRRFYQVLSRAMYSLIFWILALLVAVTFESGEKDFKKHPEHSFSYFIMTFPLYCLVMFGSYTLITIGYHMIILRKLTFEIYLSYHSYSTDDCKDAQDELMTEIEEARAFLTKKGMKL